jgi:hypothetical protein
MFKCIYSITRTIKSFTCRYIRRSVDVEKAYLSMMSQSSSSQRNHLTEKELALYIFSLLPDTTRCLNCRDKGVSSPLSCWTFLASWFMKTESHKLVTSLQLMMTSNVKEWSLNPIDDEGSGRLMMTVHIDKCEWCSFTYTIKVWMFYSDNVCGTVWPLPATY